MSGGIGEGQTVKTTVVCLTSSTQHTLKGRDLRDLRAVVGEEALTSVTVNF
jgi:vacuolar-type H+-ATPase subunit B/Vma2